MYTLAPIINCHGGCARQVKITPWVNVKVENISNSLMNMQMRKLLD